MSLLTVVPTAWIFNVSQFGEAICSGIVSELENHPESAFKDSFQIYYFPSETEKEIHPGILELFDIEASRGVVQRYCLKCKKLCVIDEETMGNYFDYVGQRKFFSKLGKVTFAARFHFPGCSHPFTPEVPEDLKDLQTVEMSRLLPKSSFHS